MTQRNGNSKPTTYIATADMPEIAKLVDPVLWQNSNIEVYRSDRQLKFFRIARLLRLTGYCKCISDETYEFNTV